MEITGCMLERRSGGVSLDWPGNRKLRGFGGSFTIATSLICNDKILVSFWKVTGSGHPLFGGTGVRRWSDEFVVDIDINLIDRYLIGGRFIWK